MDNQSEIKNGAEVKQPFIKDLYDWIEVFCMAAACVIILFTFIARVCTVVGESMTNTLYDGEELIVSGLFYEPKQGDIVVIQQPASSLEHPIVKRIIATGGQTVDIDFDSWTVYVDNIALDEDYVRDDYGGIIPMNQEDYKGAVFVPEGYVFVLGDNRNNSTDSRSNLVGLVKESEILGKVLLRIFPFSRFGSVYAR